MVAACNWHFQSWKEDFLLSFTILPAILKESIPEDLNTKLMARWKGLSLFIGMAIFYVCN